MNFGKKIKAKMAKLSSMRLCGNWFTLSLESWNPVKSYDPNFNPILAWQEWYLQTNGIE